MIDDQLAYKLAKAMLEKDITTINTGVIEHKGKKYDIIAKVREHNSLSNENKKEDD